MTNDPTLDSLPRNLSHLFLKSDATDDDDNDIISSSSSESPPVEDNQLDLDFETSRSSINNVLGHSTKTLENLLELCRETDSPRCFEATSSLITAITTASKDLLELHEKYNKLKNGKLAAEVSTIGTQQNIQNNIVFKGTSLELLELIKTNSK